MNEFNYVLLISLNLSVDSNIDNEQNTDINIEKNYWQTIPMEV